MANRCPSCLTNEALIRMKRYYGGFVCQCDLCKFICKMDDANSDPWTIDAIYKAGQAALIDVRAKNGSGKEAEEAKRIQAAMCPSCNKPLYLGLENGAFAFSSQGPGTHYCCSMCEFKIPREVIMPETSDITKAIAAMGITTQQASEALRMFGVALNKMGPLPSKKGEPELEPKPRKRLKSKSPNIRRRIIL